MFNEDLPTQLESVTSGGVTVAEAPRPTLDVDYLQVGLPQWLYMMATCIGKREVVADGEV